jgi:hypothetical protein
MQRKRRNWTGWTTPLQCNSAKSLIFQKICQNVCQKNGKQRFEGYSHDAFLKGSAKECSAGEWGKDHLLIYSSADNSRFGFPSHPCFGCGRRAGPLR